MLNDIKNTVIESAVYGLSRISNKLIAFILLPIITSYLNVNEYGIYVRIESLWQIFWSVLLFGMESGIIRWITLIEDPEKKKKFLFTVTLFLFVLNLIFFSVIFLTSGILSDIIFETGIYYKLIIFAALIATVETFTFLFFLILRIEKKAVVYTVLSIINSIILLSLQYYFLIIYTNKLEGIFTAKIFSPLIVIFFLIPYYSKYVKFGFEKTYLKKIILYSLPVMLGSIAVTLLNQLDKFILGRFSSSDAGIYGLAAYIIGLITMLVISPFSLSFSVTSWQKLKDTNAKRFYTKTITYLFLACIYSALIISLFTPHFIKIFTSRVDYWIASQYVPWIAIAISFYGIHFISVFSFYVTKQTKYILYSYLVALITSILLNVILVPIIGITGSIISAIVSFFVLVIMLYLLSKKQYFFKYEWINLMKILVTYVFIIIFFTFIDLNDKLILFFLKILAVFLFPFILYLLKFYEPIELTRIKGFFNKYLFRKV